MWSPKSLPATAGVFASINLKKAKTLEMTVLTVFRKKTGQTPRPFYPFFWGVGFFVGEISCFLGGLVGLCVYFFHELICFFSHLEVIFCENFTKALAFSWWSNSNCWLLWSLLNSFKESRNTLIPVLHPKQPGFEVDKNCSIDIFCEGFGKCLSLQSYHSDQCLWLLTWKSRKKKKWN